MKSTIFMVGTNHESLLNNAFISSSGRRAVSGIKAQNQMALAKLQTTNTRKYFQPTLSMAGLVTCPIMVLKPKEIMTPIETPLERVLVSKISAGMIHDSGPQEYEKETWYSQLMHVNVQDKEFWTEGDLPSNEAMAAVTIMKQTQLTRLPMINGQRRPKRSMVKIVAS